MKITKIEVYRLNIKMKSPFRIATMVTENALNVLVRLKTDEGITGWGEACPFHALTGETQEIAIAAAKEISPLLFGKNPLEINNLTKVLNSFLPHNSTIKSSFDMALYDIAAKAANMPLYNFLGGRKKTLETDLTIGLSSLDDTVEEAAKIVDMGFNTIKVKVGGNPEEDYMRLKRISETVGKGIKLRIDANQGWDSVFALKMLKKFEEFEIEFCEQPVPAWDIKGLKKIRQLSPIPIMADESLFTPHDALILVENSAVDYFNIKLSKSGGLKGASSIAEVADAAGLPTMVGCMLESRLGLTAAAHFAASYEIIKFADLDGHFEHAEDFVIGGIEVKEGKVSLPEDPGLGAEFPEDYIEKLDKEVDLK